jgi:hypothetical protein
MLNLNLKMHPVFMGAKKTEKQENVTNQILDLQDILVIPLIRMDESRVV